MIKYNMQSPLYCINILNINILCLENIQRYKISEDEAKKECILDIFIDK